MHEQITHLGKKVKSFSEGNKLTRDNFVCSRNDDRVYLSLFQEEAVALHRDEIKRPQIENALLSYDINMRFYNSLDQNEFAQAVKDITESINMKEVFDLRECSKVTGIYIMVLSEYKQLYIGQAKDIPKRIYQHWTSFPAFDRLVFGDILSSNLSINSFCTYDTTKVFYIQTDDLDEVEYELTDIYGNGVYAPFITNRILGGNPYDNFDKRAVFFNDENKLKKCVTKDDKRKIKEIKKMFDDIKKYRKGFLR